MSQAIAQFNSLWETVSVHGAAAYFVGERYQPSHHRQSAG
jgi:hypothetical protein